MAPERSPRYVAPASWTLKNAAPGFMDQTWVAKILQGQVYDPMAAHSFSGVIAPGGDDDTTVGIGLGVLGEPVKVLGTVGGGVIVASSCGRVLTAWGGEARQGAPSTAAAATSVPTDDFSVSGGSALEDDPPKKCKRNRFCKDKRDKYRKLVERLVQVVRNHPDAFDLEAMHIPLAVMRDDAAKAKLLGTVMRFAAVPPEA